MLQMQSIDPMRILLWRDGRARTQQLPGIPAQRIDKDAFRRLSDALTVTVHTPTPLSQTKINPVRGAVTGPRETGDIHQGFQQQRLHMVVNPPIVRELFGDASQQVTRKRWNANPRENQEAAVIDDLAEVGTADGILPTNPPVSRSHFPSRTGKQQASQQRTRRRRGMDKVTQLRAIGNAITQVVILLDVLLEEEAIGTIINQPDLDRQVIPQITRHWSLRVATTVEDN